MSSVFWGRSPRESEGEIPLSTVTAADVDVGFGTENCVELLFDLDEQRASKRTPIHTSDRRPPAPPADAPTTQSITVSDVLQGTGLAGVCTKLQPPNHQPTKKTQTVDFWLDRFPLPFVSRPRAVLAAASDGRLGCRRSSRSPWISHILFFPRLVFVNAPIGSRVTVVANLLFVANVRASISVAPRFLSRPTSAVMPRRLRRSPWKPRSAACRVVLKSSRCIFVTLGCCSPGLV